MDNYDTGASIATLLGALLVEFVLIAGLYVWVSASLAALFKKVGEPAWAGWVPFYNQAVLLKLGGFSPWLVLVLLVPLFGGLFVAVLLVIAAYRINLGFGYRDGSAVGMTILAALLFPVWSSVVGWGSARWVGPDPRVRAAGGYPSGYSGTGFAPAGYPGGDVGADFAPAPEQAAGGSGALFGQSESGPYVPGPGAFAPPLAGGFAPAPAPPAAPEGYVPPAPAGHILSPQDATPPIPPAPRQDEPLAPQRDEASEPAVAPDLARVPDPSMPNPASMPDPSARDLASAPDLASARDFASALDPSALDPSARDLASAPDAPVPHVASAPDASVPHMASAPGPSALDMAPAPAVIDAVPGRAAELTEPIDPWAPPAPATRLRRSPLPEEPADFSDTSAEVSAVAGAAQAGAPLPARSSVSAQGVSAQDPAPDAEPRLRRSAPRAAPADAAPRAAVPADAAPRAAAPADGEPSDAEPADADEVFDETVIAPRRRIDWTLIPPNGAPIRLTSPVLIVGRRPASDPAYPQAQLIEISDETRTVSKTHARLELAAGAWSITDLGSTNGVVLVGDEGTEIDLPAGAPRPAGERFLLGDAELRLTRTPS